MLVYITKNGTILTDFEASGKINTGSFPKDADLTKGLGSVMDRYEKKKEDSENKE